MKVTTIILARNEELSIERTIDSAKQISSAILVIDDKSSDKTVEKAKSAGATVLQHSLNRDFSQQRNWAMEQAQTEWVLFLDADEVVSKELSVEIEHLDETHTKTHSMFFIKRIDYWQGKKVTYGEVYHASNTGFGRLVHKAMGTWQGTVHETWKVASGIQEHLKYPIEHYPHQTVKEFLEEVNSYSTARAKELYASKKAVSILEVWAYPLGKFIVSYFFLLGFLDGAPGFIYSFMMSFHSFLVRSKLYQYYHIGAPEV
jgi:glycosyltransferase involved in cell wall biosynthesis